MIFFFPNGTSNRERGEFNYTHTVRVCFRSTPPGQMLVVGGQGETPQAKLDVCMLSNVLVGKGRDRYEASAQIPSFCGPNSA